MWRDAARMANKWQWRRWRIAASKWYGNENERKCNQRRWRENGGENVKMRK